VAGGEDGVKRGFSILDWPTSVSPKVLAFEVSGSKKQRYRGCFECDK
jgi:hypothetical protein